MSCLLHCCGRIGRTGVTGLILSVATCGADEANCRRKEELESDFADDGIRMVCLVAIGKIGLKLEP
jgi:hypothetical protein